MYPVLTRVGLPDTNIPASGAVAFSALVKNQAAKNPGVWTQREKDVQPGRPSGADPAQPSPSWFFKYLPQANPALVPHAGGLDATPVVSTRPDDSLVRNDWLPRIAVITGTVAQSTPAIASKPDPIPTLRREPDIAVNTTGWIAATFVKATTAQTSPVMTRPTDPVPFTPKAPDLATQPGWIFWFVFIPGGRSLARENMETFPQRPPQPEWPNGIPWVKTTFPAVTTPQLAGVWSLQKAIDPGKYPPWLPEPGPFDPFVWMSEVFMPVTVPQQAGIWSQRRTIDPGPAAYFMVEPPPNPAWIFKNLPSAPPPVPGRKVFGPLDRRLKLLGIRWSTAP
jgi:hypothetical protein